MYSHTHTDRIIQLEKLNFGIHPTSRKSKALKFFYDYLVYDVFVS